MRTTQHPRAAPVAPNPLPRIPSATAAEVLPIWSPTSAARALLTDDLSVLHYLDRLVAQEERYPDAVDFLAHALPKREAVWWGCLCLWGTLGSKLAGPERHALRAAVVWVLDPNDPNRQAANGPATRSAGSPAGTLAAAVFRSGGSLLPPDLPPAEPGPGMTGDTVAAALHLAAAGEDAVARYRKFVALGIGVARGKHSWVVPKVRSRTHQPFWPGQGY